MIKEIVKLAGRVTAALAWLYLILVPGVAIGQPQLPCDNPDSPDCLAVAIPFDDYLHLIPIAVGAIMGLYLVWKMNKKTHKA